MNEIDKLNQLPTSGNITSDIRAILSEARKSVARAINTTMTAAYWLIGKRIVEEEQNGADRAAYGENLLRNLSKELTSEFGNGFSYANLYNMRQFYLTYNNEIFYTLCIKLPWSHNRLIMRVTDSKARGWYTFYYQPMFCNVVCVYIVCWYCAQLCMALMHNCAGS